ncbi:hypothetical protein DVF32_17880 [Salmonella enterica subsp. diarizonae]|nr:hypothetical protein [Salmonella enterica subsp. diarizonae]ECJ2476128.1 hypothetical protein [Salmonella enterica subsp. diarizonae]
MFKIFITLINHDNGERREFVHNWLYKSSAEAREDAGKMAYIRFDKKSRKRVTHECIATVRGPYYV